LADRPRALPGSTVPVLHCGAGSWKLTGASEVRQLGYHGTFQALARPDAARGASLGAAVPVLPASNFRWDQRLT